MNSGERPPSNASSRLGASPGSIGQLIASSVVLLPVIGFVGTSISLYLNNRLRVYGAFSLALDHSVPWLAWHGAIPFLFLGVFGLGSLTGSKLGSASIGKSKRSMPQITSRRSRIVAALSLGTALLLIPLIFINLFIGLIAIVMLPFFVRTTIRSTPDRSNIQRYWLPLAILVIASTVMVAVIPSPIETGNITFAKGANVPNGNYLIVGTDGSQTLLLPCARRAPLVSVNDDLVLSIKYEVGSKAAPLLGLFQIIRRGSWPSIGATNSCPANP
jgi:hypothetical protein